VLNSGARPKNKNTKGNGKPAGALTVKCKYDQNLGKCGETKQNVFVRRKQCAPIGWGTVATPLPLLQRVPKKTQTLLRWDRAKNQTEGRAPQPTAGGGLLTAAWGRRNVNPRRKIKKTGGNRSKGKKGPSWGPQHHCPGDLRGRGTRINPKEPKSFATGGGGGAKNSPKRLLSTKRASQTLSKSKDFPPC